MKHPSFTTETYFKTLVGSAYTFYVENARLPTAADLVPQVTGQVEPVTEPAAKVIDNHELTQYPAPVADFDLGNPSHNPAMTTLMKQQTELVATERHKLVERILMSNEWAAAMAARGVPWRSIDGLTSQQYYALALLNNPTDRRSLGNKLEALGINYNVYRAWMRQPAFANAVKTLSEQMLQDSQGQAHAALIKGMEKGDINAIKYFNELTGRHDPSRLQAQDLMTVLAQVVEIIQRYVHDPEVLDNIARDIMVTAAPLAANQRQIGI